MRRFFRVWSAVVVFIVLSCDLGLSLEVPGHLLAGLKSEEFREREEAQTELLSWARLRDPGESMDAMFKQSREADDPEARERCLAVLRSLVDDEYLREGEGYVGIQMRDEVVLVPGDSKPRGGIRVTIVMDGSAAQRGDLRLGDLIVGLDDLVWREGPASLPFSEKVRQLKPNSKVTLKVLRDGKVMDVEITLGRRPVLADRMFMGQRPEDMEAAELAAQEAYFKRWLEARKKVKGKD